MRVNNRKRRRRTSDGKCKAVREGGYSMVIDFSQVMKGMDGEPLKVKEADPVTGMQVETENPFDLKYVVTQALLGQLQGEKLEGVKSYKRFKLVERIRDKGPEVELTAEEISEIKTRVGQMYLANIVGQAWDMLDPPKKAETKKEEEE